MHASFAGEEGGGKNPMKMELVHVNGDSGWTLPYVGRCTHLLPGLVASRRAQKRSI